MYKVRHQYNSISELILADGSLVTSQDDIRNAFVAAFSQRFQGHHHVQNEDLFSVIPQVVTDIDNSVICKIPEFTEIKEVIFSMDQDSSPGPDGFGGVFFKGAWDIIGLEVCQGLQSFFLNSKIPFGFNTSFIALVPKQKMASKVDHFRPICMANFLMKVLSKILQNRLSPIMERLISSQQTGFIPNRSIHTNTGLASEMVNELHTKRRGGNVVFKVDISQAYDTLCWDFLWGVLSSFGFCPTFISWIKTIVSTAYISILVNGGPAGFFQATRGLRQGDPLSPLLFALAEEVLSRGLLRLREQRKIQPMVSYRGHSGPSHLLFADDIMIFANGNKKGLKYIAALLQDYQEASGQIMNKQKSVAIFGGISLARRRAILQEYGIQEGTLPQKYLGIHLFEGRVTKVKLACLVDNIRARIAFWRSSLISFQGRRNLISSVLTSLNIHNMALYLWPMSLIKEATRILRNFLWTSDPGVSRAVTVAWDQVTKPLEEGGLGLRSLQELNLALLMKLAWGFVAGNDELSLFLRSKFLNKDGDFVKCRRRSSIWGGIRYALKELELRIQWIVGDGSNIDIWRDNWLACGSVKKRLGLDTKGCSQKLSSIIIDGNVQCPAQVQSLLEKAGLSLSALIWSGEEDRLIWTPNLSGEFTVASAFSEIRKEYPRVNWSQYVWSPVVHPKFSATAWKLLHGCAATDARIKTMGIVLTSRCRLCKAEEESLDHILWSCKFSLNIWKWLLTVFQGQGPLLNFVHLVHKFNDRSPFIKDLWLSAVVGTMVTLWKCRNLVNFEDLHPDEARCRYLIRQQVFYATKLSKGSSYKNSLDIELLKRIGIDERPGKSPKILACSWKLPPPGYVKANVDGACLGNPGPAAAGVVFRDSNGNLLLVLKQGLGNSTNFLAECWAILLATEQALIRGWSMLWIESDSEAAISAFISEKIPWILKGRWLVCKKNMLIIRITHIFREGNFAADAVAKHGIGLQQGTMVTSVTRPSWLGKLETPFCIYYRFR